MIFLITGLFKGIFYLGIHSQKILFRILYNNYIQKHYRKTKRGDMCDQAGVQGCGACGTYLLCRYRCRSGSSGLRGGSA